MALTVKCNAHGCDKSGQVVYDKAEQFFYIQLADGIHICKECAVLIGEVAQEEINERAEALKLKEAKP